MSETGFYSWLWTTNARYHQRKATHGQRLGQYLFNQAPQGACLYIQNHLPPSSYDPFYDDRNIGRFLHALEEFWEAEI